MSLNPISPGAGEVRKRFMDELTRAVRGGIAEIKELDLPSYKSASEEFADGQELLPESVIADRTERLSEEAHLELMFPPGYVCCPALLLFSNMGGRLSPDEIERGDHLVDMLVDPRTGQTVSGFGATPSLIFNILPAKVREIAFVIPPYSHENRAPFIEAYRGACVRLQRLLSDTA